MPATPRQLFQLMTERARQDLAAWEAERVKVHRATMEVLREGLRRGDFQAAWVFGSLVTGDFGPGSDVDVATSGLVDPGRLHSALMRATGREVDVLRLEELDASFAARVQDEGEAVSLESP